MSAPTNNVTPLIKYPIYPKKITKPHYKVSEANKTDNYNGDKETEYKSTRKNNLTKTDDIFLPKTGKNHLPKTVEQRLPLNMLIVQKKGKH